MKNSKKRVYRIFVLTFLFIVFSVVLFFFIKQPKSSAEVNNRTRKSDITSILNAVQKYTNDHNGNLPSNITLENKFIGNGPFEIDICNDLVPEYLVEIPFDPVSGSWVSCKDYHSGYTISATIEGKITLTAPRAEGKDPISVSN